jgi:hypothetical protein
MTSIEDDFGKNCTTKTSESFKNILEQGCTCSAEETLSSFNFLKQVMGEFFLDKYSINYP